MPEPILRLRDLDFIKDPIWRVFNFFQVPNFLSLNFNLASSHQLCYQQQILNLESIKRTNIALMHYIGQTTS